MVADAVFGLGLVAALLGLVRARLWLVILGLAVATAARQTAIPVALVLAILLAVRPLHASPRRAARFGGAAAVALVPLAVYAAVSGVGGGASRFEICHRLTS